MRVYFTIIISVFILSDLSAQNIKNKYSFRTSENYNVLFVHPQKDFECRELPGGLEYDLTYVSTVDSITFNYIYITNRPLLTDSIAFTNGKDRFVCDSAELLFIEPYKKDNWKNRFSTKLSKAEFTALYQSNLPLSIVIYNKGKGYPFMIKQNKWNNQAAVVNKIFQIVEYNR